MKTKYQNIAQNSSSIILLFFLIAIWEGAYHFNLLPPFIIPAPSQIIHALWDNYSIILHHSRITIIQSLSGLLLGVVFSVIFSVWMDSTNWVYHALYPYLIVSQTIPTIAIAPILVLWLGYGMAPKIVLVTMTTLFPLIINILQGFSQSYYDAIRLLELMGANRKQVLYHVKLPQALPYFFSGLRMSVSYAFVSTVAAEWLGGFDGLGAYLIQTRKSFNYDQMFGVILIISLLSLIAIACVKVIEYIFVPWTHKDKKRG